MARGTKTVSFLLTTYNHEQFIREALRSVFAQVWEEPLDVHISDDCSTDGTWAIVEQEVAAYQGPFRVSAHRNTANMGPMLHMIEAMDRCSGDLLVRGPAPRAHATHRSGVSRDRRKPHLVKRPTNRHPRAAHRFDPGAWSVGAGALGRGREVPLDLAYARCDLLLVEAHARRLWLV
jgi:cellulose synthase/poly-beta-1,6-N-acetylglucosamine synthase-like glycosyltransferase